MSARPATLSFPSAGALALRCGLLALAYLHTFPARKHVALFLAAPSASEAWKGFGAVVAIVLYLLPLDVYARGFGWLWARWRGALVVAGWMLAIGHAVPASDHLPRLFATPSFADAWRGLGSTFACLWFVAPLRVQAAAVGALRSLANAKAPALIAPVSSPRSRLVTSLALGFLLGGLFGVGLVRASVQRAHPRPSPSPGPSLIVPFAAAPIAVDGELEDEGWAGPIARTGAFRSPEGGDGRPYSDARFTYRDGQLYVVLYAADEDIRAGDARHDDPLYLADAFQLVFRTRDGERTLDVSPRGVVTDGARSASGAVDFRWESHARVAVDTDGIVNDSSDMDEEWVVEMAIPLASLGLRGEGDSVGVSIRRCDDIKTLGRSCSGWGAAPGATATLVLGRDDD